MRHDEEKGIVRPPQVSQIAGGCRIRTGCSRPPPPRGTNAGLAVGRGGGGSQGEGRDPLLPHAHLQEGCVSGAGLGKLLVDVVKQGL